MTRREMRRRAVAIAIVGCGFLAAAIFAVGLAGTENTRRRVELDFTDAPRPAVTDPTTTTTTAPPTTTTTTVPPSTTTSSPPTTVPDASLPAPTPPPPAEDIWDVYRRCSRGYADDLAVIGGGTSWTRWTGGYVRIDVSQWHLDAGGWVLCWTLAHEDGHAYTVTIDPNSGGVPAGWPYGPERFADCYAELLVGGQRGSCPDLNLARSLM